MFGRFPRPSTFAFRNSRAHSSKRSWNSASTFPPTLQTYAKAKSFARHALSCFWFWLARFTPRSGRASDWNRLARLATRLMSTEGMLSLRCFRKNFNPASTVLSNKPTIHSRKSSGASSCSLVRDHVSTKGRHPSSSWGTYTMPHLDTVAGDATARS